MVDLFTEQEDQLTLIFSRSSFSLLYWLIFASRLFAGSLEKPAPLLAEYSDASCGDRIPYERSNSTNAWKAYYWWAGECQTSDILELSIFVRWVWLTSAFSKASLLSDILPGFCFSSQVPIAHPMLIKRSCPLLASDTDSFSENTPRDVSMRWMRYRLSSAMDRVDWASGDESDRVSSKIEVRGMREWA